MPPATTQHRCERMTSPRMNINFFQILLIAGFFLSSPLAFAQERQPDTIPDPLGMIDEGGQDILNFALLGSDTGNSNIGRTDAIVLVSVNLTASTAAMLSIPRDLFVYIPGQGMAKINTVFAAGRSEDDDGYALFREMIEYNLGITLDGYARVNFAGFRTIVDSLGGIEIAVDCAIQDWRLISADHDPSLEESWQLFTLPIGMHIADCDTALWYARSRRTSSDFDRGRRYQILLRSILRRASQLGLLSQFPQLWSQTTEWVETNIMSQDLVRAVIVAGALSPDRIGTFRFMQNRDVRASFTRDGASIQIPIPERITQLMRDFLTPPTEMGIGREKPIVEVINATSQMRLDEVAAERLRWEGFTVVTGDAIGYRRSSELIDLSGAAKGSSRSLLQELMRIDTSRVTLAPSAGRSVDFRIILGADYYACTHNVIPPVEPSTPQGG
jgi:LCP family protein required for cell wall assembly